MALLRSNGRWRGSAAAAVHVLVASALLVGCGDKSANTEAAPDQAVAPAKTAAAGDSAPAAANTSAEATPSAVANSTASADSAADGTPDEKKAGEKTSADSKTVAKTPSNSPDDNPDEKKPEETAAVASASAAPAEEAAGKHFGKKQVESMYAAWLQSGGCYVVGKPGNVQAVVIAKGEYKCNDKYPYRFKLGGAPAGVSYPAAVSRNVSKGKARSVVSVPFTPTSAGKKTISGTFYFSVCNESSCKMAKKPLSLTVTVHES